MRDVISEFNSELQGSPAFCALMLFICLMCSGNNLQVECILPFWDVVLVCVDNDICEYGVCSMYIWWSLNVRESSLRVCS